MKLLQTDTVVKRFWWRTHSRDAPYGSGYCEDQGLRFELVKRWFFLGLQVWSTVLETEEIAPHVWIHLACFGDMGGYKSPLVAKQVQLH